MPTNIVVVRNDSDRSITGFNSENKGNSFMLNPGGQSPPTGASCWISWHKTAPLVMFTKKGVCRLWDTDWTIFANWEGTPGDLTLLKGQGNGVGGQVRLNVSPSGDVSFTKL